MLKEEYIGRLNRYICKWCWHCECNEEYTGIVLCSLNIGEKNGRE